MRIQVVLMYKSGDEANEKALEAMLYAEMAVQEIAEMGGTVNSMLPRMCMRICKMHAGLRQCIDFSFLQSVKNARMHFSGGVRGKQ